ncbi:MAG: hypothetical protein HY356_06460 [Gammaproteobacteria bacterium]|nr:hypothetical protein [Gammaproteobacteria bacterium]
MNSRLHNDTAPEVSPSRAAKTEKENNYTGKNSTIPARKKLPPYGRLVKQAESKPALIRILSGVDVWDRVKEWGNRIGVVVFPGGSQPSDFNWSICNGRDVHIIHITDHLDYSKTLNDLAVLIIQSGANLAVITIVDCNYKYVASEYFRPRRIAA